MTTHQLSLEDALRAREEGMDRVLAWAGDYKEALYAAIEQLAATGRVFTSDDIRDLIGDPPPGQSPNIAGAVFGALRKKGVIDYRGFTRSTRKVGHANTVLQWVGVK